MFIYLATDWIQWPEESAPSQFKEKRVDLPIDAAVWLQHFRSQNQVLLTELEVRIILGNYFKKLF